MTVTGIIPVLAIMVILLMGYAACRTDHPQYQPYSSPQTDQSEKAQ